MLFAKSIQNYPSGSGEVKNVIKKKYGHTDKRMNGELKKNTTDAPLAFRLKWAKSSIKKKLKTRQKSIF